MVRATRNIAEVVRRKLAADQVLAEAVHRERFNANVASEVLAIREQAGLTQKQLADRVGTHQSVIARLEDADYESHSLKMLQRIADALGKGVEIRFVEQDATAERRDASRSRRKKVRA